MKYDLNRKTTALLSDERYTYGSLFVKSLELLLGESILSQKKIEIFSSWESAWNIKNN